MRQLSQKPPVNIESLSVSCENNENGTKGKGTSFSKLLLQIDGKARGLDIRDSISFCFPVQNAKQVIPNTTCPMAQPFFQNKPVKQVPEPHDFLAFASVYCKGKTRIHTSATLRYINSNGLCMYRLVIDIACCRTAAEV